MSDQRSGLSLAIKSQVEGMSTQMLAIDLRQASQSAKYTRYATVF